MKGTERNREEARGHGLKREIEIEEVIKKKKERQKRREVMVFNWECQCVSTLPKDKSSHRQLCLLCRHKEGEGRKKWWKCHF